MQEKSKNIFENSSLGTIGLRINHLIKEKGFSIADLESKGKIGNGTLKTWKDKSLDFSSNVLQSFIKNMHIDEVWWRTGEGEPFIAPDFKEKNNKEIIKGREAVYQTIVEGYTEYVLVPRSILDNTQLVSSEQINRTWDELEKKNQELERKNKQIDFYQDQIARLMQNLELAPKSQDSKEVK